jgi:parallel beta-helix repeat protein
MHRTIRTVLAAVICVSGLLAASPALATTHTTWVVSPNQSIQAAVDKAKPGDTVLLTRGTFKQTVTITTDNLTLAGAGSGGSGSVIRRPTTIPKGLCKKYGGGAGVCVFGQADQNGNVIKRVTGVTVTGIRFVGWNVGFFAYGTKDLTLTDNAAADNAEYGLARFDSLGGVVRYNTVTGGGEAGIYLGDSADAGAKVQHNVVSGAQFGIFVRHSSGIEVKNNQTYNNCQGILLLDDGEAGGVSNITVENNVVSSNNLACAATQDSPALQGGGILLLGATDSEVGWNIVRNNQGSELNSGGILLLSAIPFGGTFDPSNDAVHDNSSYGNTPADISWDGTGSGNTFTDNHCGTSVPSGSC